MRHRGRNPRTILTVLVAALLGLATTFAPTHATAQPLSDGVYPATGSYCLGNATALRFYDFPGYYDPTYGGWLHAPEVVHVYWPGDQPHDPMVRSLLGDFVTDLFASEQWNAVMPQYFTPPLEGDVPAQYLSSHDITLLTVPLGTTPVSPQQIEAELSAQMKAGNLPFTLRTYPQPRGHMETLYVVHMPPGVIVESDDLQQSCRDFCGYHKYSRYDPQEFCVTEYLGGQPYERCVFDGPLFAYALLPDFSQSACATACGSGATPFDRYTELVEHEIIEAITNPFGDGWANLCAFVRPYEELVDVCSYDLSEVSGEPVRNFYAPRRTYSDTAPQCPNRWSRTSSFSNAVMGCVVAGSTTDTACVDTCDGCDIDGIGCVPAETVDPTNPCAICDPAENASAWSPRVPSGGGEQVLCRAAQQACELDSVCPAGGTACPAENPVVTDTSHVCRTALGICDVAETCDGVSRSCPDDAKSTAVCRVVAGPCDVAESCDGSHSDCPADAVAPEGTECRGSVGVCDVAESCTGSSASCPADAFASDATPCTGTSQDGACDAPDHCSGTANTCVDAFQPATATCRAAAGQCDAAEHCTGASGACPADALAASGTSCDDGNQCTGQDTCNGSGNCVAGPGTYGFEGFFSPVDNPNVVNTGKAGRAFPLKWKLPACAGGYVSTLAAVTGQTYRAISCDGSLPQDPMPADAAASGSSGLRYDSATNQYAFNWQTTSSFANKCYEFRVTFDNGSSRTALFKFTK